MPWIKVCGITNIEDARAAVDAGADALGFVFAESSRRVDAQTARTIASALGRNVDLVGVFVDQSPERIVDTVVEAGLTAVQLHGGETVDFARKLHAALSRLSSPVKLIRSVTTPPAPTGAEALGWDPSAVGIVQVDPHTAEMKPGVFAAVLVDSGCSTQRGGTGKTFDWHGTRMLFAFMQSHTKVIVAGGLTPENVAEAVELFQPWGVDVSSGVEAGPGKKDPEKVKAFIGAVRATERRL
jgi:phosphoribosylanthranilate isomerase